MEGDPRDPLYPRNFGDLCRELKRSGGSGAGYRKALEIDANHAPAYNDLGILYQEQKRFDEAESQYRRAYEADPREPVYPRNLGDLCRELKRSEEAEAVVPQGAGNRCELCACLQRSGNTVPRAEAF